MKVNDYTHIQENVTGHSVTEERKPQGRPAPSVTQGVALMRRLKESKESDSKEKVKQLKGAFPLAS